MSPDLVVAGREEEADRLLEWLREEPSALTCRADSREEALAFFAAALHRVSAEERAPYLSRAVVVEEAGAWRQLATAENALLLVPMFEARDNVSGAVGDGHHVLVPLGRSEGRSSATVELPRPRRPHVREALMGLGLPEARAERLAGLGRRSQLALRRELAVLPEVHRPEWAKPAKAGPLLPAMLVGTWDDANDADRAVVGKLAGTPYGEIERALVRWANESDPPVRRVGDKWLISSKEDSWTLLAYLLARGDLDRFEGVVLEVLGEIDPAFDLPEDRRWMAGVLVGSLPHSGLLREGLADTLALMGARNGSTASSPAAASSRELAGRVVRRLLERANEDWRLWASLSGLLPLLAEAAPEQFLEAVGVGLSGESPVLANLFSAADGGLFGGSPHTGLLWALEGLAWNPDLLGRAARLLAKLARIDPGGRTLNRPQNSLREIFLCWNPQTAASLDRRFAVLNGIRAQYPQVAWRLMRAALPEPHSIIHPAHKPCYRDWAQDPQPTLTWGDVTAAIEEIVGRLLEDVGLDGQRWQDLIEKVDDVPKQQRDAVIDRLLRVDVGDFGPADRTLVRDALRSVVSKHREFPDADWAMPGEDVDRLQEAHGHFEPDDDLISEHAWLFSDRPHLLEPPRGGDRRAEREAIETARLEAAGEVYARGGLDSLLEMAASVGRPFELGRTLGGSELLTDEEDEFLGQGLGSADAPRNLLARGLVIGRRESRGWPWVEAKLADVAATWPPEARAEFFGHLHFEGRTWDLLETSDEETRRLYWTRTGPYGLLNTKECQRAVGEYLKYDRPYAAADLLTLHIDDEEAAIEPSAVADVLERVIGTPPPSEGWIASSFAYHVGELLDFLEESGEVEEGRMAGMEWGLLPLLEHRGRPPRALHRALSRDPGFFAEVLELVFKPEGDEPPELSEEDYVRARLGNDLLDNWQEIPGRDEAGSVDPEALRTWVGQARQEAGARGRRRTGDHLIGKALVFSPKGSDDAWPHEAVRDLLEELESEDVERGMEISVYNSRGVVTKDPTEGGEQERRLVEAYRGHAENLSDRWPRTSALLRRIAEGYDSDARREDLRAELREDLWG